MEGKTKTLALNEAQHEAIQSEATETFLIGGVGLGKTFFLATALAKAVTTTPGTIAGLFAPTVKQFSHATFPQIVKAFQVLGIKEDVHYVKFRRPPAKWGIQFRYGNPQKILTFANGSYVITDGLDNFNSQRGQDFDLIFIDEYRDVKEGVRDLLLGRLRGETYRQKNLKHKIFYATTPPENPGFLLELRERKDEEVKFITGSTFLNQHNLPKRYITNMVSKYDEITTRREVYGELISAGGLFFAYEFDKERHVIEEDGWQWYNPTEPLWVSFDFNVNPFCAGIFQFGTAVGSEYLYQLDEVVLHNASIRDMVAELRQRLPANALLYITGDASGRNRHVMDSELSGAYEYIRGRLELPPRAIDVPRTNPPVRQSWIMTNSLLRNLPDVRISDRCVETIRDLEFCTIEDERDKVEIDKSDPERSHCLDFFRYIVHTGFSRWFYDDIR
jgi:hypothetical protein